VRDALNGMRRFSELQTYLEIVPDQNGSGYKAYVLTKRGEALGVVLVSLW
jgi:hypothetical protein